MTAGEKCPFMQAAYPDLEAGDTCADHRHDDQTFALGRALAAVIHQTEPNDEQIGWFLDDAAAVVDDFDPVPAEWTVTTPVVSEEFGVDFTLTINGVDYVVPESEWEPSRPVSLAEWREWQGDDEDEEERP